MIVLAIYAVYLELHSYVNYAFLVLIFWGQNCVCAIHNCFLHLRSCVKLLDVSHNLYGMFCLKRLQC